MDDRTTFDGLKSQVLEYVVDECHGRDVYLMGESFGGILATEVSLALLSSKEYSIQLRGLILVNPATSYLRSTLYKLGPPVANNDSLPFPLSFLQYIYSLTTQLVPLFLDEGRSFQQLITILSSKGLPAVVNNSQREAYMGRIAFDLANRLKFMPQETLKWRLEEWLATGNELFEDRLKKGELKELYQLKTLIVVGEKDLTLPSVEEAERLSTKVFNDVRVKVVKDAGHASTNGGSLNLIQVIRDFYPRLQTDASSSDGGDTNGANEDLFGLVPRYDNASIGLSPLLYWSEKNYRKRKQ